MHYIKRDAYHMLDEQDPLVGREMWTKCASLIDFTLSTGCVKCQYKDLILLSQQLSVARYLFVILTTCFGKY
jgi:hypothetical protein